MTKAAKKTSSKPTKIKPLALVTKPTSIRLSNALKHIIKSFRYDLTSAIMSALYGHFSAGQESLKEVKGVFTEGEILELVRAQRNRPIRDWDLIHSANNYIQLLEDLHQAGQIQLTNRKLTYRKITSLTAHQRFIFREQIGRAWINGRLEEFIDQMTL